MIDLENIHSLTDFKRNASGYVEQIRTTKSPMVLTINGEAAVVVQDASSFQEIVNQIRELEEKLRLVQQEALKAEIRKGVESGEATPLDMEDIIRRGQKRATQRRT
ncbi:type II toxin-antitoxin system Phd/YefM family antitoxin [Lusitaniella coriacea LEGE 07157]|uniref:Antitoxin n=1 Tax=Lusitaniella coriacea LEGE 07157 TaxID=945747 RepID=A0A8J7E0T6_9CYAN|nr:type II toxin-antitoxin system Phd/YefM family antitoxin [Lusitaniella coriacea]MBE9117239.1 type II toxin-antitoxin system Phd/YefM family antitoxin [Lusitaniella coriacea LEGE 07157]